MFDYLFAEQHVPDTQCPNCNAKIKFHGGYYPKEVVCQNCGCNLGLTKALSELVYPNIKYDENGSIIREEKQWTAKE